MGKRDFIQIDLYRGKLVADSEDEMSYLMMNQLLTDVFHDKPVNISIKAWTSAWWRLLLKGGWRAPLVLINGKVFSQGVAPPARDLILHVSSLLNDEDLRKRAEWYVRKKRTDEVTEGVQLFSSPTCPHCRDLKKFLDDHNVSYDVRNVVEDIGALNELKTLTGRMSIPVTVIKDQVVIGYNVSRLGELLGITPDQSYIDTNSSGHFELKKLDLSDAVERAKETLLNNRYEGSTRASAHLYPHQWNWDAGFVARGYLNFDPEKAYEEMRSLFKGQWSDGFLPHIIFNSNHLDHFPGYDYWKAGKSHGVPEGVHTSGISQPPVHASMIVEAVKLDRNKQRAKDFFKEIYPRLKMLHDYYFKFRDPENENLVMLVHPWESGLDNSPLWDTPLANITDSSDWAKDIAETASKLAAEARRPKRSYIEKYSYLVQQLFLKDYQWKEISETHPVRIQDVLFNSILYQSEKDLAKIAQYAGENHKYHLDRAQRMREAINKKLWDEDAGLYYSYDMVEGKHIEKDTIFSYIPLYAGICSMEQAERLIDNLKTHCYCLGDKNCVGVPSYDMCQADFNGEFYWRGPVWVNINWYLVQGLRKYGEDKLAYWLEHSLLELISNKGFYEYYSPDDGRGLGADEFSWTAALFLEMANKYRAER